MIPIAGLALGALGRLFNKRRTENALRNATATATAATPSETGVATAATSQSAAPRPSSHGLDTSSTAAQDPGQMVSADHVDQRTVNRGAQQGGDQSGAGLAGTPTTTDPASGPPQDNLTTPAAGDAGLAARLGKQAVTDSRRKNRNQQASLSQNALAT